MSNFWYSIAFVVISSYTLIGAWFLISELKRAKAKLLDHTDGRPSIVRTSSLTKRERD